VTVLQPVHFDSLTKALLGTLLQYLGSGGARQDAEGEVRARLAEFQAYERQDEDASGSDSECEIDPQQHLTQLRTLLPDNTIQKLQRKCAEIEQEMKTIPSKEPAYKHSNKPNPAFPQPPPTPL
jgi:hypothetical protein